MVFFSTGSTNALGISVAFPNDSVQSTTSASTPVRPFAVDQQRADVDGFDHVAVRARQARCSDSSTPMC